MLTLFIAISQARKSNWYTHDRNKYAKCYKTKIQRENTFL